MTSRVTSVKHSKTLALSGSAQTPTKKGMNQRPLGKKKLLSQGNVSFNGGMHMFTFCPAIFCLLNSDVVLFQLLKTFQ